jgi:hypothetical protein
MRKIVPVLKVGDKVTSYSESLGVCRVGVVTKVDYYIDARCYFVQYPNMKFEDIYKERNLRETLMDGHGRHVFYIRPYESGDEYKVAVTNSKRELSCLWDDVVDKITTMEQCEELKRVFEEIKKEHEDAKKAKNDQG